MDDNSDTIRQQMEETKSQLSDKLESLELQVSETVQSTGTAVNATVEAVQETVETVTGAVQEAVQFVTNACDIRRQVERNPLVVIGGAFVLGYLAIGFLSGRAKRPNRQASSEPVSPNGAGDGTPINTAATQTAIAAAYESGRNSSSWVQLREQALLSTLDVVRTMAIQAVPHVIEHFKGTRPDVNPRSELVSDSPDSQGPSEVPVWAERPQIATPETNHSRNSF